MSCFGPFITTEAHIAFSGARIHSNNTVDMTAMIEALSFLGPRSPVTHDEQSCICHDSLHAAGNWLGTAQARTHVQLALECQQSLVHAQRRLRFTMQHVYGHSGNLVNECADHAAALGTFGLISNHHFATRWTRHNFEDSACVDGCNNISEILERLQHIRKCNDVSPGQGMAMVFLIRSTVSLCTSRELKSCVSLALRFFSVLLFSHQVMDRLSSSASTVPSIDDYFEHNMWNPLLELLFLEQANGVVASYLVEIDVAKIAISCHFALDLLCYKKGAFDSRYGSIGHHCPWSVFTLCGTIATPGHRDI